MYVPKNDKHKINFTLSYQYYKNVMPILNKLSLKNTTKEHRLKIIDNLNIVRKLSDPVLYNELISDFYNFDVDPLLDIAEYGNKAWNS